MARRDTLISRSIIRAIFRDKKTQNISFLARVLAFFTIFQLKLARFKAEVFKRLRDEVWQLDEDEYRESFREGSKKGKLNAVGDLGYSGSTFFTTPNSKYLIKSLPRHFEHAFFTSDLFAPYVSHMSNSPASLLVRITDFLYAPSASIGRFLGTAPAHHVVMENILYGKESDSSADKWETYDLKPQTYFYPERDIMDGRLASESIKDRLIDKFEDKIRISSTEKDGLIDLLDNDTKLLEAANAVDYSLFLVRYPSSSADNVSTHKSKTSSPWREGLESSDGKWIYRAVILDFFWAKHALQAKAMTGLIDGFNFFARRDQPMSITTSPDEYRQRFMRMVSGIVEAEGDV